MIELCFETNYKGNNKMEINVSTFSVRDSNGNINVEATVAKFEKTLGSWDADTIETLSAVRKAISDVFDANPGKNLPSNYILAQVTTALNLADEKEFKLTESRVNHILAQAPYSKTRGANGGVKRNVEAVVAPVANVSDTASKKQSKGKSGKKQGGKSQPAQA